MSSTVSICDSYKCSVSIIVAQILLLFLLLHHLIFAHTIMDNFSCSVGFKDIFFLTQILYWVYINGVLCHCNQLSVHCEVSI